MRYTLTGQAPSHVGCRSKINIFYDNKLCRYVWINRLVFYYILSTWKCFPHFYIALFRGRSRKHLTCTILPLSYYLLCLITLRVNTHNMCTSLQISLFKETKWIYFPEFRREKSRHCLRARARVCVWFQDWHPTNQRLLMAFYFIFLLMYG